MKGGNLGFLFNAPSVNLCTDTSVWSWEEKKKKILNYCTLSKAQNKLTTTTCNLASKFASGTAFI